jgi:hypothetical protein
MQKTQDVNEIYEMNEIYDLQKERRNAVERMGYKGNGMERMRGEE